MSNAGLVAVFAGYFLILVGIAVARARRMRAMSDYVLAGRGMGGFTSALSASSSGTSGWAILVFPALAFQNGLREIWTALALVAGIWFSWQILAKRLRRYSIATDDALTVPAFLERRFEDPTGSVRVVAALITIFFIVFYVSSGLVAGAKLLNTVFDLNQTVGLVVTLIAIASYTLIGGFMAVSRTDVFQASLMLVAFIMIPLWVMYVSDHSFKDLGAGVPGFWNPLTDADNNPITAIFLLSAVGWGLGYLGSQRVVQRYMAVESEAAIPLGRNVGTAWMLLVYAFALLVGLVALPALQDLGRLDEVLADRERVFLVVTQVFFHPVVGGVLLSAVIAAVMSTADSQLLLASAIATEDLPLLRKFAQTLDSSARVWLGRGLLVVTGVVSLALLWLLGEQSVFSLVAFAWGGMAAAFAPATILALYWRRFNWQGAVAAMVVGTLTAALWARLADLGGVMAMNPATPGCLFATLAGVGVALATPPPPASVTSRFDEVVGVDAPPSAR